MSIRPSVMAVDDEEELANLFRTFLERSGFDSVSFTDPQSALDHFRQNREKYSVVKTDWKKPNLDGTHLAKKIRDYSTIVKILLITGYLADKDFGKQVFQDALISHIVEKPFKLKELKPELNSPARICPCPYL